MRLTGSEPHPGLLGSAQSSSVMQACQDIPCSDEVWPPSVPTCPACAGRSRNQSFPTNPVLVACVE